MPQAEIAQPVAHIYKADESRVSTRKVVGAILSILVPAAVWFAPLNFDVTARHALAVSAFMFFAWITEAIPHALTGLIGCYLFWVLKVVKFDMAFSGFADQTPWFLDRKSTRLNSSH